MRIPKASKAPARAGRFRSQRPSPTQSKMRSESAIRTPSSTGCRSRPTGSSSYWARVPHDRPAVTYRGRHLKGAGRGTEAKAGVDLGGAHLWMRDDDGPGPVAHASASRADETAPRDRSRGTQN